MVTSATYALLAPAVLVNPEATAKILFFEGLFSPIMRAA